MQGEKKVKQNFVFSKPELSPLQKRRIAWLKRGPFYAPISIFALPHILQRELAGKRNWKNINNRGWLLSRFFGGGQTLLPGAVAAGAVWWAQLVCLATSTAGLQSGYCSPCHDPTTRICVHFWTSQSASHCVRCLLNGRRKRIVERPNKQNQSTSSKLSVNWTTNLRNRKHSNPLTSADAACSRC